VCCWRANETLEKEVDKSHSSIFPQKQKQVSRQDSQSASRGNMKTDKQTNELVEEKEASSEKAIGKKRHTRPLTVDWAAEEATVTNG
jgi:hypothetical protein